MTFMQDPLVPAILPRRALFATLVLAFLLAGCVSLPFNSKRIASDIAGVFDRDPEKIAFRVELGSDGNLLWHDFEEGKPVSFDVEPRTGFRHRFGVGFLRLLPIESRL